MKITTTKLDQTSYGATDGEFDGIGSTRREAVANCRENREAAMLEERLADIQARSDATEDQLVKRGFFGRGER